MEQICTYVEAVSFLLKFHTTDPNKAKTSLEIATLRKTQIQASVQLQMFFAQM